MSAKSRYMCIRHLIYVLFLAQIFADSANANNGNGQSQQKRNRDHIDTYLKVGQSSIAEKIVKDKKIKETLGVLSDIYHDRIKPLENFYKFNDLNKHVITDAEIRAKPLILFVGPWSVGKSTMINYLVGMEDSSHLLHTGAEPTTSDFTVVMHGDRYKTIEGMVLATDPKKPFSHLEKFGQGFLEKFQGVEMPYKLLEKATFVDTPGIIENRKQQERGYPFNEVMRWFIDRADLIFVVFDPSKLDVGTELESLFRQLKGRESQIRIILNKADSISPQELMRVYGALFWNLAPLINVTEPPRVYTGSFWDNDFKDKSNMDLFYREEYSLLHDLNEVIENQVENKIAFIRQHAYLVRIHALLVDAYLEAFTNRRSIFGDYETLLADIVENPAKYHIYNSVLSKDFISKYDLPNSDVYKEFFANNALNYFKPLTAHCSFMDGCAEQNLLKAFLEELPLLLSDFKDLQSCDGDSCGSPSNP